MLIRNPPDKLPWPETQFDWQLFKSGIPGLSFGFAGFLVLAWLLAKYLPKFQLLSGLILVPATAKQGGEMKVSMTRPPENETEGLNVGDTGEVISTLRPAGKAKFADAIVDCVAAGEFLDKGTKIEIIKIRGNKVVVKSADSATLRSAAARHSADKPVRN